MVNISACEKGATVVRVEGKGLFTQEYRVSSLLLLLPVFLWPSLLRAACPPLFLNWYLRFHLLLELLSPLLLRSGPREGRRWCQVLVQHHCALTYG